MSILKPFKELNEFLASEGIKHFKGKELVTGRLRGNRIPIKNLWDNIIPTLNVLDTARDKFGSIKINSCYRNEIYNRKVGGASKSKHKLFKACDIKPLNASLDVVASWLEENIPSDKWGLRLYETFIHIDCRSDYKYRDI